MNKLKNKVFYVIFTILTISILSFIIVFNTKNYLEQKNNINNNLNVALNNHVKEKDIPPAKPTEENPPKNIPNQEPTIPENEIDENTKFLDYTIYTILLDDNNNIKEIINHSTNTLTDEYITNIANNILSSNNIKEKYLGNLYLDNYLYAYNKGTSLVIFDNTKIKSNLIVSLEISLLLFIFLEVIIIFISKTLTTWIIKPVIMSFNKQKQFIADASHELKTPLSVIMASCDAYLDNPKEKKWLKNIETEANHMNILITNLLDLASSEQENVKLTLNNLSKVIELSVLTFEGKAYENNIKLSYEIEPNISMKFNESNIKQLVEILLDNAIKHSYTDSTIMITLHENQNNIEFLVQNEGEPIPKGEEEKIFERFYRVDKSRNRKEGRYGLGLAIAKNIVQTHHGKISASSNNGTTTFKVLFKK